MWKVMVLGGILVAACGGDGGRDIPVDAAKVDTSRADAAVDAALDAPADAADLAPVDAAPVCSVNAAFGSLSLGTATSRALGNWFASDGDFLFGGRLSTEPDGTFDLLIIDVKLPTAGFATNTAYANQVDATSPTFDAYAMILGNYDQTTGNAGNMYWAITGATTFTAIGTTTGSAIDGSTSMMSFEEIDQNTGEPIAGGCTTTIDGITFHLQQN